MFNLPFSSYFGVDEEQTQGQTCVSTDDFLWLNQRVAFNIK
jgi:hypothetical protein